MSNTVFVCFDCRVTVRRPGFGAPAPKCPHCASTCRHLGTKRRVPPKADHRGWAALQTERLQARVSEAESAAHQRTAALHELERRIQGLEDKPENRERSREIKLLRARLEGLRSTS